MAHNHRVGVPNTVIVCAGEPFVVKKAVCLHEEDAGFLWKHVEYRTGQNEVRRSRRLVISMVRCPQYLDAAHTGHCCCTQILLLKALFGAAAGFDESMPGQRATIYFEFRT